MSNEKVGEANVGFERYEPLPEENQRAIELLDSWREEGVDYGPDLQIEVEPFALRREITDAELTALSALVAWREAERELFVAKAAVQQVENVEGVDWRARHDAQNELIRCLNVEREKRALAMAAADALTGKKTDG
jgi:hypothetical protein